MPLPNLLMLSLMLNVVVLAPVSAGLLRDAAWARAAYGAASPGRGILLAIYLSILAVSAAALVFPMRDAAAGLLLCQVIYKAISPFTAGSFRNPVIVSNLAIAAFHAATLATIGLAGR